MALPFEVKVALRYMQSKRQAGVSITGILTVAGVATGVWALTVVTSVWNGFEAEFLEKLLGINAHAIVLKRHDVFRDHQQVTKRLKQNPQIVAASPFVYSEVIVQTPKGTHGVAIKGINPDIAHDLPLAKYLGKESPRILRKLKTTSSTMASVGVRPGILIGSDLQKVLHVKVGESISIISPHGGRDGDARTESFDLVGVFHSGMFEFDSRMVFISLGQAQRFFRYYDNVTGLEVWAKDPLSSLTTIDAAARNIDPDDPYAYEVKDWSVTNRGLFGAVRSQKVLISIVLFFIVIVAAFNIMATLILLIMEKSREIAVLKSLGATDRSILTIFVLDGQIVGMIGCLTGVLLGLITCAILQQYGLKLDPRVYYLERLPIVVRPLEVLIVAGGAMALATTATIFPALRAARMNPVDGLARRVGGTAPTQQSTVKAS